MTLSDSKISNGASRGFFATAELIDEQSLHFSFPFLQFLHTKLYIIYWLMIIIGYLSSLLLIHLADTT